MALCKFQNMDQCGKRYCDFWNEARQICAFALETHQRVEMFEHLNKILGRIEKSDTDEETLKLVRHLASLNSSIH